MHRIAILTYGGAAFFELGCAIELFALPRPELAQWYQCDVVSFDDGPCQLTGGVYLTVTKVDSLSQFDTLVVPSWPTNLSAVDDSLTQVIGQFNQQQKRIISFCSGAFLLAQLGLLDGCQATTHWRYADLFKERFPAIEYVDNVLYVVNDRIACSAGSAAAIDLGLEIIRHDFGHQVANQVAKRMVICAHRNGGQAQFVDTPISKIPDHFANALDWALSNLAQDISIEQLASKAVMTRRTFDRQFRRHFDQSAKEWLTQMRLNKAKSLLEEAPYSIENIAGLCGFDNAMTMRHHFRKWVGVSPIQYRQQFRA